MKKVINDINEFIKTYVSNAGAQGVVLGMSGGKDSFVVAKLCADAIGKENVFGLILPNGKMKDIDIAKEECEYLGINFEIQNIENIFNEYKNNVNNLSGTEELNSVAEINLAPRIRMIMLYTFAANKKLLVVNTSNLSEIMIGYTTKWGDSVGDFAPIADLTKTEVCEIGLLLGLPEKFVNKTPDDGLSGKSDEDKIGFTYAELDDFIRNGNISQNQNKIEQMHKASKHKRNPIEKYISNKKNYFN